MRSNTAQPLCFVNSSNVMDTESLLRWQKRLRLVLAPLGAGWAGLMRLRRTGYDCGLLPRREPDRPTVSVGGAGSGGAGKTPMTGWLLEWAGRQGLHASVLSRGYGGRPPTLPFLVHMNSAPGHAGDEPLMLARLFQSASVVVDPVRRRGADWAAAYLSPDLFVLDDGLQHQAVGRDLDIVCMTAEDLGQGWNCVLPAGTWREGAQALRGVAAVCVKTASEAAARELLPLARRRLEGFAAAVFTFYLRAARLRELATGRAMEQPETGDYLFFAGLADPAQAASAAAEFLGRPPVRVVRFEDHHQYTSEDIDALWDAARGMSVDRLVCTAKDAVKLAGLAGSGVGAVAGSGIWALESEVAFGPYFGADVSFPFWWEKAWSGLTRKHHKTVLV